MTTYVLSFLFLISSFDPGVPGKLLELSARFPTYESCMAEHQRIHESVTVRKSPGIMTLVGPCNVAQDAPQ